MANHCSTLAWRIPWTEEPCRLLSMGSLRVGHDWATSLSLFTFMHWRRQWQPIAWKIPGTEEPVGLLSVGSHRVGHDWRDLAAAAAAAVFILDLLWWLRWLKKKNLPPIQETQVQFRKDPLEKRMVTHSSSLAWRIQWTEEPGGLQSLGHKEWLMHFFFSVFILIPEPVSITLHGKWDTVMWLSYGPGLSR